MCVYSKCLYGTNNHTSLHSYVRSKDGHVGGLIAKEWDQLCHVAHLSCFCFLDFSRVEVSIMESLVQIL